MTPGPVATAPPTVQARGPLSEWLLARPAVREARCMPVPARGTGTSDDLQLALYLCYEVHYSDIPALALEEWDPRLLEFRSKLECEFLTALTTCAAPPLLHLPEGA